MLPQLNPVTPDVDWEAVAFEVARNKVGHRLPVEDLLPLLNITLHDFELLCDDPLFARRVKEYVKELTTNGTSFALKAQMQAEDLLKTQYRIAKDPDTPPSVAVAAIQNVVRWAGYDKRAGDSTDNDGPKGPKISININLGNTAAPTTKTITVENGED